MAQVSGLPSYIVEPKSWNIATLDYGPLTLSTDVLNVTMIGVATQATLASLLTELQLKADLADTQPISAAGAVNPATAFGKTITYVSVNQGGAGTTVLAAASVGNKHKVMGAVLVMSLLGTIKFTDTDGDLTGPMDVAANGGFVLPSGIMPWTQTTLTNKALNLVTALGAARGVVAILTEA